MTSWRASRNAILELIQQWFGGQISASEFQMQYWPLRTKFMDEGETFSGRFGIIASKLDTAVNSFSEAPSPDFYEIDQSQLRLEVRKIMDELLALS